MKIGNPFCKKFTSILIAHLETCPECRKGICEQVDLAADEFFLIRKMLNKMLNGMKPDEFIQLLIKQHKEGVT